VTLDFQMVTFDRATSSTVKCPPSGLMKMRSPFTATTLARPQCLFRPRGHADGCTRTSMPELIESLCLCLSCLMPISDRIFPANRFQLRDGIPVRPHLSITVPLRWETDGGSTVPVSEVKHGRSLDQLDKKRDCRMEMARASVRPN
jgi:hypothetical protein